MNKAKDKWNRIYSEDRLPGSPSVVLTDNADILPGEGIALDLACGRGNNSVYLASRGLEVHAWDISEVAVNHLAERAGSSGLKIDARVVDITASTLPVESYDLVVMTHYLDRTLPAAIMKATRPGGLICYQTFTAEKQLDIGPSNPEFLLQPGELESFVAGCEILAMKDGSQIRNRDDPLAGRAYVIARKPANG